MLGERQQPAQRLEAALNGFAGSVARDSGAASPKSMAVGGGVQGRRPEWLCEVAGCLPRPRSRRAAAGGDSGHEALEGR